MTKTLYVFVGENRSKKAIDLGVTWKDGKLAARTLFEALRVAGIDPDPDVHKFVNLFHDGDDFCVDVVMLDAIRRWHKAGRTVVALGRRVQGVLSLESGMNFIPLVHPAARGKIRARTVYQAHVATALGTLRCEDVA